MSTGEALLNTFHQNIQPLKKRSQGVVISFSGGPDSCALLDLAHRAGLKVFLYYYLHNLRTAREQAAEHQFVIDAAARYECELHVDRALPGFIEKGSRQKQCGIEAFARLLRYRGLKTYREKKTAGYVFTAHNQNDEIETLIMRFFQGFIQIKGIPYSRGDIIRPLLQTPRSVILEYLEERKLPFFTDSSNSQNRFLRNAVRNRLLPVLEDIFPGYKKSLFQARDIHQELFLLLSQKPENTGWKYDSDCNQFYCDCNDFNKMNRFARISALLDCHRRLYPASIKRIPAAFFESLPSTVTVQTVLLDGHGIILERHRNKLVFRKKNDESEAEFVYLLQRDRPLVVGGYRFELRNAHDCFWQEKPLFSIRLRQQDAPYILRSRRPGDSIKTQAGSKKLKKLFLEWGIAGEQRSRLPLLCGRNGIIAVPGGLYGGRNQLSIACESDTITDKDNQTGIFFAFCGEQSGTEQ